MELLLLPRTLGGGGLGSTLKNYALVRRTLATNMLLRFEKSDKFAS